MADNAKRRTFLKSTGAVIAGLSVAGCSQTPSGTSESTTTKAKSTTDSVEVESGSSDEVVLDEETTTTAPELGHLHGITGQTYPPDIDGNHHRRFEWDAIGYEWWFELNISRAIGEYYNNRFARSQNYDFYVTDPYGSQSIQFIADEFTRLGNEYDLSKREIVNLSVAFVQHMEYTTDALRTGFDQTTYFPVQTLIERGGDCEDVTILMAAILRKMGYDCVLLGLWDTEPQAHMALGVWGDSSVSGTYYEHEGRRYYYIEATAPGRKIGEMPDWGGSTQAEIIEIHEHPTLVYNYQTSEKDGGVLLDAGVWNYGQLEARGASFHAEFVDKSEQVHAEASSLLDPLAYEEDTAVQLRLEPPEGETLRLNTIILTNGNIHDFDRSEWRRPVN